MPTMAANATVCPEHLTINNGYNILSGPAAVVNGVLYFGSYDDAVHAFHLAG
jgi:outer membrane protein assembly factor BamB